MTCESDETTEVLSHDVPAVGLRVDATAILISAMLRLLADLTLPARATVSAANALLAHERQRLAGRLGLAGLLAEEVRQAIIVALTRVLADETAPARTTIAAANSLLALDRNRLRAERQDRIQRERQEEPEEPLPDPPPPDEVRLAALRSESLRRADLEVCPTVKTEASGGLRPPLAGSGNPSPGSLREPPSPSRGEGPGDPLPARRVADLPRGRGR
jgi:hypothetical protein